MNDPLNLSLGNVYSGTFPKDQPPANKLLTPMGSDHPHSYLIRIDNSTLEKWQTCPRAYEYYAINGKEKPGSPALNFGSAAHMGWEILGNMGMTDLALDEATKAVTEHFTNNPQPEGDYRDLDYCLNMLRKYVDHHKHANMVTASNGAYPLVEFPFSLHIGEMEVGNHLSYSYEQLLKPDDIPEGKTPQDKVWVNRLQFFWSGKMEQVVKFDGRYWVMDHKTTSMGGPTFYQDFMLSQQTVGYVWAARKMFPFPIDGFILDAAICRKPTKTGKGLEFERQFFSYEDWHTDEWYNDVSSQLGACVDQLVGGYFPKKTKWCMGKYGACPYHDVCTLAPVHRTTLLESSAYGNVTWSPLKP